MRGTSFYSDELGSVCTVTRFISDRVWWYRTHKNSSPVRAKKPLSHYTKEVKTTKLEKTFRNFFTVDSWDGALQVFAMVSISLHLLNGRYVSAFGVSMVFSVFLLGRILNTLKRKQSVNVTIHQNSARKEDAK